MLLDRAGQQLRIMSTWLHFQWLAPAAASAGCDDESNDSSLKLEEVVGIRSDWDSTDDCSDLTTTGSAMFHVVVDVLTTVVGSRLAFESSAFNEGGFGTIFFLELFFPTPFAFLHFPQTVLCRLNSLKVSN